MLGSRFAVLFATSVICLVITEVVLQWIQYPLDERSPWAPADATGFSYVANAHQQWTTGEYDMVFETNSVGFRDDEIGKKEGFRIVLLGDSFASGYGVQRDEQFADLLEADLQVDIVNTATGGWDLEHQYHFFKARGKRLEPDLVVYAMYLGNDIVKNGSRPQDDHGIKPGRRRSGQQGKASRLFLLYQQASRALKYRQTSFRREWVPWPPYLEMCEIDLGPQATRDYKTTRVYLELLRNEVRKSGNELIVAFFSYRTVVERAARERFMSMKPGQHLKYDLDKPVRIIEEQLSELGIRYVDLNIRLKAADAESPLPPLYFFHDGHWTPRSHGIVAATLHDVLKPMID